MRTKLRSEVTRPQQSKSQHRAFPSFEMHLQLETIGEQRLHHQPHLVLGRVAGSSGFDVE